MNESNSYTSDPDVLLMLEFQSGDRASFENLMRKYYKRIFNFALRMLRNREAAEDIAQETFIRVYQAARAYQPKASFRTWLYTISKNLILNELNKNKRFSFSVNEAQEGEEGSVPRQFEDAQTPNPFEALSSAERTQKVHAAIESLPPPQRMAVVLYRFERLSYEEVSEAMGTSVSAVKSLLSRARKNLRVRLTRIRKEI